MPLVRLPSDAASELPTMSTIRLLRAVRGLSQRELSAQSGIAPHRLWRLENHVSSPTRDELIRMLNVLST